VSLLLVEGQRMSGEGTVQPAGLSRFNGDAVSMDLDEVVTEPTPTGHIPALAAGVSQPGITSVAASGLGAAGCT
jgi:hypothetical protein